MNREIVRAALVAEGFEVEFDSTPGEDFVAKVIEAAERGDEALANAIAGGATWEEALATARRLMLALSNEYEREHIEED